MSRSLGIPVKLLHESSGHIVSVEMKSGELYRGSMIECEDNWNCQLENITYTAKDGKVSQLEHVFIRGSKVRCCTCFLVYVIHGIILVNPSCLVIDLRIYLDRFMVIPDILKHAPMFKRLDARIKGKSSSLGVGRGRGAMRGKPAAGPGRGTGGRGAVPPVRR